jgi:ABC-type proline/glycine betaine transport system permease subunit
MPLAKSTILAGINQVILLALMVVIASMVGAKGLGSIVYQGIQQNDIAKVLNLVRYCDGYNFRQNHTRSQKK